MMKLLSMIIGPKKKLSDISIFDAIKNKDYESVKDYFRLGGELAVTDRQGNLVIQLVIDSGDIKLIDLFFGHPKMPSILKTVLNLELKDLVEYIKVGNLYPDISKLVIPEGYSNVLFPIKYILGELLFYKGAYDALMSLQNQQNYEEIIKCLKDAGYDFKNYIVEKEKNSNGLTLLYKAVLFERIQSVKFLIYCGEGVVDVNAGSTLSSTTALMLTAEAGRTEIVRELLKGKPDLHKLSASKKTAIMLAKENDHIDCVQLLYVEHLKRIFDRMTFFTTEGESKIFDADKVQETIKKIAEVILFGTYKFDKLGNAMMQGNNGYMQFRFTASDEYLREIMRKIFTKQSSLRKKKNIGKVVLEIQSLPQFSQTLMVSLAGSPFFSYGKALAVTYESGKKNTKTEKLAAMAERRKVKRQKSKKHKIEPTKQTVTEKNGKTLEHSSEKVKETVREFETVVATPEAELIEKFSILEWRFSKKVTSAPTLQSKILEIKKAHHVYIHDLLRYDEILEEKIKQSQETARLKPNKRDRSKTIQEEQTVHQSRLKKAEELKKSIEDIEARSKSIVGAFYKGYDENSLRDLCEKSGFEIASEILEGLKEHVKAFEALFEELDPIMKDVVNLHEALLPKFIKNENEKNRNKREQEKIVLSNAKNREKSEAAANKLREDEENEKNRLQAQIEENKERRKQFQEKREAYLAERKAKLIAEHEAREKEAKVKEEREKQDGGSLLFSDKHQRGSSRKQRAPLTMDAKGGITDELAQASRITKISNEVDILVECLEACMEMNFTIEKILKKASPEDPASLKAEKMARKFVKLQRNALLGTLARCMEHLKHLKNGEQFTGTRAQKFRNYLFKGSRFLLTEKQNLKLAMELNAEIVTMINEIIFCIRKKEAGTVLINSRLLKELEAEADVFTKEDVPELRFCKQGMEIANAELEFYQKCLNAADRMRDRKDSASEQAQEFITNNALLIHCAENYSLAARGAFALWIRDHYPESYRDKRDYKAKLIIYIEEGNIVRHNDVVQDQGVSQKRDQKKLQKFS